jgi:predicted porin
LSAHTFRRAKIAMGVLAAFAAADCAAQHVPLTLYGRVHVSVERLQAGGTAAVKRTEFKNNTSRIGIRGSYDVGNNFYAFYQIESGAAADGDGLGTGSNTLGGRETFAGFGNTNAGSIKIGNFYHPYDDLHYISGNYWQLFTGTSNDATLWANGSNAATGGFDQRLANGASYYTPNWNGIQGKLWYSLTQGPGGEEALGSQGSKVFSASLAYDKGGARLAYAYYGTTDARVLSNNFFDKNNSHFITGGYTFGQFYLAGLYERDRIEDINGTSNERTRNYFHILGKYTMGKHVVGAWYGKADEWKGSAGIPNSGAKMFTIGYSYAVSPQSGVYALYTKLENESTGAYVLGGSPARGGTTTSDWTPARQDQPGFVLGGFINFQFPS